MEERIVIAYRTILETAIELEDKAADRTESPSFYGQTAAGLRTAAAVIKGTCYGDSELTDQLKKVREELQTGDGKEELDGNA
jgi:hypothetical protein